MCALDLAAADGVRLDAVLHHAAGVPLGVVVSAHGIAADKDEGGMFVRLAAGLVERGFTVLRFSFRGHGSSGGGQRGVTIAGELLDLQAAICWCTALATEPQSVRSSAALAVAGTARSCAIRWSVRFVTVDVDCVIVAYNSGADLPDCLSSIAEQNGVAVSSTVVVDNASADDSVEVARRCGASVVANRVNRGFGPGVNQGVAQGSAKWVLILNPDARLDPDALRTMIVAAESTGDIGCVGPRVVDAAGVEYPSRRRFPNLWVAAGHAVLGRVWKGNPATRRYHNAISADRSSTVDWVSGCCMVLPRHVWEQVGGFDPKYFMYLEDVDLCWRLRRAGWRAVWEPAAIVTHLGGRSSRSRPLRSIVHHHLGAARFYWRSAGWHRPITWPVAVVALTVRAGIQALAQGRWR
jgi:N-acetylglucosaminyl-diphospho-decaprenol L-rhamnosyltransferase